jgi:hypothetical protein
VTIPNGGKMINNADKDLKQILEEVNSNGDDGLDILGLQSMTGAKPTS